MSNWLDRYDPAILEQLRTWQAKAMAGMINPPPNIVASKKKVRYAYQLAWYDAICNVLELMGYEE